MMSLAENPAFAGLSHAPREIRTPTTRKGHKALNLAGGLHDPSISRISPDWSAAWEDLDLVDAALVVTALSRSRARSHRPAGRGIRAAARVGLFPGVPPMQY